MDRDDGVVHEDYWGEFSADRISLVASSSKMITAGVLLHLADEGLLDMDAPVAAAVDWGAGNPTITPAQLVSSSSGLVGLLDDPSYPPYVCQFLVAGTLQDCAATDLHDTRRRRRRDRPRHGVPLRRRAVAGRRRTGRSGVGQVVGRTDRRDLRRSRAASRPSPTPTPGRRAGSAPTVSTTRRSSTAT